MLKGEYLVRHVKSMRIGWSGHVEKKQEEK
jgi:hypothetical protein